MIASDRAAVPEVLGDAGWSLPLEADAWADALDRLPAARDELVRRGTSGRSLSSRRVGCCAHRGVPSSADMKIAVICPHFARTPPRPAP
ncbi:MAG: hypothetical protein R2705_23400 [Ilumatobacteraceae bacterium]